MSKNTKTGAGETAAHARLSPTEAGSQDDEYRRLYPAALQPKAADHFPFDWEAAATKGQSENLAREEAA